MCKSIKIVIFLFFIIAGVIFFGYLAINKYFSETHLDQKDDSFVQSSFVAPSTIQAVYLTNYSASSQTKINEIIELTQKSEINSVVIDIKDWSGYIFYETKIPEADLYQSKKVLIKDLNALINKLHQNNIYTIARIVVFQDPILAKIRPDLAIKRYSQDGPLWLDNLGLAWLDPTKKEVWDYNIALARDALAHGFDEVNFDYIRFPSDGNLSAMVYPSWQKEIPRYQVIKKFFEYVRHSLPGAVISADLFGYTTIKKDDLGIGQVIEDAFPNFNFICPMTYPSLYRSGFLNLEKPGNHPYLVVKNSMEIALNRLITYNEQLTTSSEQSIVTNNQLSVKFRPWVQSFKGYDQFMINEQIRAIKDALNNQYAGYIIWNPSNNYSNLFSSDQYLTNQQPNN